MDAIGGSGTFADWDIGPEEIVWPLQTRTVFARNNIWYVKNVGRWELTTPITLFIDPVSGFFSWTPAADQASADYPITVQVTDDGSPALSDTMSFTVHVHAANRPPVLAPIDDQSVDEWMRRRNDQIRKKGR